MESSLLFNVFITVLQELVPWIFSIMTLVIVIMSWKSQRCRDAILWGTLPQFVTLALFCGWLSQIGLGLPSLLKTLAGLGGIIMLGTQVILLFTGGRRHTLYLRLGCHILGAVIFVATLYTMVPQFFSYTRSADLQTVARKHLAQIENGKGVDYINNIDDPAVLEEMLDFAVVRSGSFSETVIRHLTNRVESPFYFSSARAENSKEKAPFFKAFDSSNAAAVRLFCESLTASSPQADKNRRILRQDTNLLARALSRNENSVSKYIAVSKMVLDIEPDLLNESAWKAALDFGDRDVIRFFWSYRPPQTRENAILALAMLGKEQALVAEITQTPQILEKKTGMHSTLLSQIVCAAEPAIVQAVVDTGVINWKHFIDDFGESQVLANAFNRATQSDYYQPLQPQILKIIMRGMVDQHALPEEQITRYLSLDEKGTLSDALSDAGFNCQRQIAMANEVIVRVPHRRFDTSRICGPGRPDVEDYTY